MDKLWEHTASGQVVGAHSQWTSCGSTQLVDKLWEHTTSGQVVGAHN